MTITAYESEILQFLESHEGYHSPTEIGGIVGGRTSSGILRHSAWASPKCKRLVKKGYITRNLNGHYEFKTWKVD